MLRNLTNRSGVTGKTNTEPLNCPANTNNQLTTCSQVYDAAGNMTSNGSATYVYDAENRLIAAGGYSYLYDGDGQRVEKCAAATSTTACPTSGTNGTLYWRGVSSDPLSETDLSGNVQNTYVFFGGQRVARRDSAGAIHFYFSDHLGSHGVVENATASTCEQDIDYYPYGGVEHDYCPNAAQSYKFTGKERDAESGLDYFGIRHNASSLGRFMSPDSIANDWELSNPQTWSRYAYARNNPLVFVDPDGAAVELFQLTDEEREKALAELQKAVGKDAGANLYINEVKDGDKTRYFVGIKGNVGDFMKMGDAAHDLANLVQDKQVVEFGLTNQNLAKYGGAVTYDPGEVGNQNVRVLVNSGQAYVADQNLGFTVLGTNKFKGQDPKQYDPLWRIRSMTPEIMTWHELGHGWGGIHGRTDGASNSEANAWENRMRQQVYGPLGPENAPRISH
jgi:RHS repeat-associated protein